MGEVEWADTELSERDNVCECCETQWRSSVKVIDGQKILEKPCPKCGWNYKANFILKDK